MILKKRKRKPIYPVFEKRIFITNPDKIDVKKTKAFPEMKWKLKCKKILFLENSSFDIFL